MQVLQQYSVEQDFSNAHHTALVMCVDKVLLKAASKMKLSSLDTFMIYLQMTITNVCYICLEFELSTSLIGVIYRNVLSQYPLPCNHSPSPFLDSIVNAHAHSKCPSTATSKPTSKKHICKNATQ